MKILEIEISPRRIGELMRIASSLSIEKYPVGESKDICISWIDSVIDMLREDERYELSPNEVLMVFRHLGIDDEGLDYVRGLFGVDINC